MRSRRDTELLLLIAATPVVTLLFALVHGSLRGSMSWSDLTVPAILLAGFFGAHIAARFLAPGADSTLLPIGFLLSGVGLAFITRLNPDLASSQLNWMLVGIAALAMTLVAVRSLEHLARYKYTIAIVGIVLLVLPAVIGTEVNGARLWLRLGSLSFQPAEIAKILIVLFLGSYLAENREVLSASPKRVLGFWVPPARNLGPLLLMWAVSLVVLVAEKDLGSSLLFFGIFLVMLYAATGRPFYVVTGTLLFAVGATTAYFMFEHVQQRVAIWLDPFADAAGQGYQLAQSLFALGAGRMIGVGVGNGMPTRIPFVETDFIFSAIAEEIGLLGGAAIIIVFLAFCLRGLSTASRARSDVAALMAVGLVTTVGLQTFVIVGGVTRLIPLTGITLPFVSYGGSSILSNFILLALLMRAGDSGTGRDAEIAVSGGTGLLGRIALTRRLTGVAGLVTVLMVALVLNLTNVQVVQADELAANPANTRGLVAEMSQERGSIVSSDGVTLATSVKEGKYYTRSYPQGTLAAHVLGYHDITYGRSGIEASMNEALSGKTGFATISDLINSAAGIPVSGNDVHLTIDIRVQRAAEAALKGHRGAIVAIDPRTGAILAEASSPTYDPGTIATEWESLNAAASGSPLVDRANTSLYPPGSTFKIVTLAAALSSGIATPDSTYAGPASIEIGGAPVTNYGGSSYGTITLRKATASSVNTVYAQIADALGPEALVQQSEDFGFNSAPPSNVPTKASLMPEPTEMTRWETAWAGIGQPVGEHASPAGPQTTALQMALVAAGIANHGLIMQPYLVSSVTDRAGQTVTKISPRAWRTATDTVTAKTVSDLMVEVVKSGSGTRAAIPGITVAGKTGTAEVGGDLQPHAWFIGFAPADNPTIAVAVVLENSGTGGVAAAPVARAVLEAALAAR